jgi:hypothetical protein
VIAKSLRYGNWGYRLDDWGMINGWGILNFSLQLHVKNESAVYKLSYQMAVRDFPKLKVA